MELPKTNKQENPYTIPLFCFQDSGKMKKCMTAKLAWTENETSSVFQELQML